MFTWIVIRKRDSGFSESVSQTVCVNGRHTLETIRPIVRNYVSQNSGRLLGFYGKTLHVSRRMLGTLID